MNIAGTSLLSLAILLVHGVHAMALSRPIGRDVHFPGGYDPATAAAIRNLVRDEQFHFVHGTVSHWSPDFGTRLSFTGEAALLNAFLRALRDIPEMGLRVLLYQGRDDELRRDSPWQPAFSHVRPARSVVAGPTP
jgi:hypothetical protein